MITGRVSLVLGVVGFLLAHHAVAAPPPKKTKTTVSSSNPISVFGEPLTFTGVVDGAGAGTPTGTLDFFVDGAALGSGSLAAGTAVHVMQLLPVGTHTVTAAYAGDAAFAPSVSAPVVQSVTMASTTTRTGKSHQSGTPFGLPVTFTASVDPVAPSVAIPTGSVTIRDGANALATLPLNSAGNARIEAVLSVGNHSLSSEYAGSVGHAASTSAAIQHRVDKSNTTGTLTTSPNPSLAGQAVTFTATVAQPYGTVIPTGPVILRDRDTNAVLATPTLDTTGTATFTTSDLPVGLHRYILIYDGDGNYVGGGLAGAAQTVIEPDDDAGIVDGGLIDGGATDGGPTDGGPVPNDAATGDDGGRDEDASALPPVGGADAAADAEFDSSDPGGPALLLGSGCDCSVGVDVSRARGPARLALFSTAIVLGAYVQRRLQRRR